MKDKLIPVVLSVMLAACGGGGGGGGKSGDKSPSPSNLNPGGNNPPANMQSGIFSDGPVSGLRFVQGQHSGVTDAEGRFTYNANSAAPVQFFIGELYLGSAPGADVVTPFNLLINNMPASLDAGINISRTLMSLDTDGDPDNGIALPDSANSAGGQIEFGLTTAQFEVDPQVTYLLQRHAEGRDLVSVGDARQHVNQNTVAAAKIAEIEQRIEDAVSRVDVRWDNTRTGAGILAHYQASNGEQLVVELSEQDDTVWLSRAIYADASGAVRVAVFERGGSVAYVDNNGAVNRYVQIADFNVVRFVENSDVYRPVAAAYLAGESGLQNASKIHPLHASRINDIAAILQRQMSSTVTEQDRIQLAAHLMSLFGGINCAGVTSCSFTSALSGALDLALANEEYRDDRFSIQLEPLADQICLNSQLPASPCPSNRLLANLLVLSSNRVQTYAARHYVGNSLEYRDDQVRIDIRTVSNAETRSAISERRNLGPYGFMTYYPRVRPTYVLLNENEVLVTLEPLEITDEYGGVYYQECEVSYAEHLERFREYCTFQEANTRDAQMLSQRALAVFERIYLNHAWVMTKSSELNPLDQFYSTQMVIKEDAVYPDNYTDFPPIADKTAALQSAIQGSEQDISDIGYSAYLFHRPRNLDVPWALTVGIRYQYNDPQLGTLHVEAHL